jgi:hypothetical protein
VEREIVLDLNASYGSKAGLYVGRVNLVYVVFASALPALHSFLRLFVCISALRASPTLSARYVVIKINSAVRPLAKIVNPTTCVSCVVCENLFSRAGSSAHLIAATWSTWFLPGL